MAHVERMQTECPPDAHKVIRPPENEVKAYLCVRLDPAECDRYGIADFCNVIGLMSSRPLLLCSDELKDKIIAQAQESEIDPAFLQIHEDGTSCHLNYASGAQSQTFSCVDLTDDPELAKVAGYLDLLGTEQIIIIDAAAMLILRSISTVYPWDKLLAGDYLRQYLKARKEVTAADLDIFREVRYGRVEAYPLKEKEPRAYRYLQLERKLYLQYPDEDD